MDSAPQFLSVLLTTIQQLQAARGAESVDVSYLGNTLLKGGHNWLTHGFLRLSEALSHLRQENLVDTFRNDKGALLVRAIAPSSTPAVRQPEAPPIRQTTNGGRFRPLRAPVWFAFAATLPDGQQRLINRRTGMIVSNTNTPPEPQSDWVPVNPVGEDEQRTWAEGFLEHSDIGEDKEPLEKALLEADWYRRFPAELERRGRFLVRDWNHLRSERIINHVKSWAITNNVADDVLFAAERSSWRGQLTATGSSMEPSDLRQALLHAVAKMATEDLLALPIKVRLVLEVVRPDLLR